MSETYSVTFDEEYLMHWGIKGMRWGDRNGPPYPLNKSEYSMAEKRANGIKPKTSSPKFSGKEFHVPESRKVYSSSKSDDAGSKVKPAASKTSKKISVNDVEKGTRAANNLINAANRLNNSIEKSLPNKKSNSPDLSKMSDDELRKRINRLNMEKQYSKLTEKDTTRGTEYVREALEIAGGIAGLTLTGIEVYKFVKHK